MLDVDDENPHPGPSDGNALPVVPDLGQLPVPVPAPDDPMTIERRLMLPVNASGVEPTDRTIVEPTDYFLRLCLTRALPTLETNLPRTTHVQITNQGCAWLLGRSRNCAVVFPDPAISRCHAVLSYEASGELYLMDTASSNGTRLNGQRLIAMQAQRIKNGDVIVLSHIPIQIWIEPWV
jgi:hypothetical protein